MTTVLVPTDFSPNANNALAYASALAKRHNPKLILLHSYDIPLMAPAGMFTTRASTMQYTTTELREAARTRMAALVTEYDLGEHPHRCMIREGSVVSTIVEEANKQHCDLVIMGTLGESSMENLVMGSVTNAVIRKSKTPVLAIPHGATFNGISRIVYATQLNAPETETFENLADFAEQQNAILDFVYINDGTGGNEEQQEALARFITQHPYKKMAFTAVDTEDAVEGINQFAQEQEASMVALTTHSASLVKQLFHRSVAKTLALHSRIPLLVYSAQ